MSIATSLVTTVSTVVSSLSTSARRFVRPAATVGPRRRPSRAVPEGIRITKVGLWYVLFAVVVAVAATNTGNNALYMVLALMLAVLVISGVLSRQNVRRLGVTLEPPGEIYAKSPFHLPFEIFNRGRLLPRWMVLVALTRRGRPALVPFLPRQEAQRSDLEVILPRRGRHPLKTVHVSSLYPFGFFRKGVRYRLEGEVLVFPELFPAATARPPSSGRSGDESSRYQGRGHDLHSLRDFRAGDDPRGIHWKQTARTGDTVFMERAAESGRRLAIVFDNGVGPLEDEAEEERFEHLVSEAATAAVDYLSRDFEVELVTRDRRVPFGAGRRQRLAVLEALALVEPVAKEPVPLKASDSRAPELRLGLVRDSGGAR